MIRRTLCLALLAVGFLSGCCVPQAQVTGRPLTARPIPPGRMALLPPSYDPRIEYPILAVSFIRTTVLTDLVRGHIDISYDDLDGHLQARPLRPPASPPAATTPPAVSPPPAPRTAPPFATVLAHLRQAGYTTACLPVIRRYGHYLSWVPTTYYNNDAWPYYGGFYGGLYGDYGFPDLDEGEQEEGDDEGDRDPPPQVHVGIGYGYGYGYGYWPWPYYSYSSLVPGHYRPASGIEVEFHIFNVSDGREIYYLLAEDSSFSYTPVELERGFDTPLVRAFRQAFARP